MDNLLNQPKYVYADILIALAQVDNHIDERERTLLDGIFAEMGLDPTTVAEMWLTPRTTDVVESILSDIRDAGFKRCLLKDAYLVAYADEQFHVAESAMINQIVSILKIDSDVVEQIKAWVNTAIAQQRKAQELFGTNVA